MTPPEELLEAQLLDALCRRYGALPSQVLAEDVSILYRYNLLQMIEGAE